MGFSVPQLQHSVNCGSSFSSHCAQIQGSPITDLVEFLKASRIAFACANCSTSTTQICCEATSGAISPMLEAFSSLTRYLMPSSLNCGSKTLTNPRSYDDKSFCTALTIREQAINDQRPNVSSRWLVLPPSEYPCLDFAPPVSE